MKTIRAARLKVGIQAAALAALISCSDKDVDDESPENYDTADETVCEEPEPLHDGTWPTRAGGMSRHAYSPDELMLDDGALHLAWKRFFGERIEVEMEPLVSDGMVYLGIMNGKMYAVDAKTGEDVWVYTAGGAVSDTPSIVDLGDTKALVFGAHDGVLFALDAQTGGELWRFTARGPFLSTPSAEDGRVFIGDLAGWFYGIDAATGELDFELDTGAPISCTSAVGLSKDCKAAVFFANGANTAYSVSVDTGEVFWKRDLAGLFTKRTMAVYGRGVAIFVTRKPGHEYSEPADDMPAELQGSSKPKDAVLNAWADYYTKYPNRRTLYYLDAHTGEDKFRPDESKKRFTPMYIPYWGEYVPSVDDEGGAWFAASGSGGEHGLDHDERLWRIDLTTGETDHVAYPDEFKLRSDEVGRATLIGTKYFQTMSEDVGYFDTVTSETNKEVFGNGFSTHRKPLELDELPKPIFGGLYKHFGRFGSSGPGAFGGGNDAPSPLVPAEMGAFFTTWGHLYALAADPVTATSDYAELDPGGPPASTLDRAGAAALLSDAVRAIVDSEGPIDPASRLWHWSSSHEFGSFRHCGEVVRTLSDAIVHVDSPLKEELTKYIRNDIESRILNPSFYEYRRACLNQDAGTLEDPCSDAGILEAWFWNNPNLVAERLYALYRFMRAIGDPSFASDHWSFVKETMMPALRMENWDEEAGFFLWESWLAGNFDPNLQAAGMEGLRALAEAAGDAEVEADAAAKSNRMTEARVEWGRYVRGLYTTIELEEQPYDNWESWGFDQSVSPMPVEGRLDASNDFRQPYLLARDDSGKLTASFENIRDVYPYRLIGFHPIIPELVPLLQEEFLDILSDYVAAVEILNPWWYEGDFGHQVCAGSYEEDSTSILLTTDLFQVHARVFEDKFSTLAPMLPWAFEDFGPRDIFRVQNLVALLEAED